MKLHAPNRGSRHAGWIVGGLLALGLLLVWLFPEVAEVEQACRHCQTVRTGLVITGTERGALYRQRLRYPVEQERAVDCRHDFNEGTAGGYRNVPRWHLWRWSGADQAANLEAQKPDY